MLKIQIRTRTVQSVATCLHSPSARPASPCVQDLQRQAEQGCPYWPTSVNVYTVRYGHICMCKHAIYRSASAAGWLTEACVDHAQHAPAATSSTENSVQRSRPASRLIRRPLPSLTDTCGLNSSTGVLTSSAYIHFEIL